MYKSLLSLVSKIKLWIKKTVYLFMLLLYFCNLFFTLRTNKKLFVYSIMEELTKDLIKTTNPAKELQLLPVSQLPVASESCSQVTIFFFKYFCKYHKFRKPFHEHSDRLSIKWARLDRSFVSLTFSWRQQEPEVLINNFKTSKPSAASGLWFGFNKMSRIISIIC